MIYSADTADIASEDVESYHPSITELDEEERIHTYKVDNYIENTICPKYHHQLLKKEVEYYQEKYSMHYGYSIFAIHLFLFIIPAHIIIKANLIQSFVLSYLISTIIGIICYFIAKVIYKKYWRCSKIRLTNYYAVYSSYDWYNHYCYLLSIKQTVIFRYSLRRIFEFLAGWVYFLFIFEIPE